MLNQLIDNKPYKTDKFASHWYLETYNKVLPSRKESAKNVLEIGVDSGGSVLLWRDYFTNAQIYGLDIIDTPPDLISDGQDRITFIKQNAYTQECINDNFASKNIKFDVLIDDGPHMLESMIFFARHYSSLMAEHAVMIIEDIPDLNWTIQLAQNLPDHLRLSAQAVGLQYRNHINRWNDVLFVVET